MKLYISLLLSLTTYLLSSQNYPLNGDVNPCQPGCYTYFYDIDFYELEVINISEPYPRSHTVDVFYEDEIAYFTICYDTVGEYIFLNNIFQNNPLMDTMIVNVGGGSTTLKIEDTSPCNTTKTLACIGDTKTYTIQPQNGTIFTGNWSVQGSDTYSINQDGSIEVTWTESGPASL